MNELPDYVAVNRDLWDRDASNWVAMGERAWTEEPSWGIWQVPEADLSLLPDDMGGMRAIELGCGTAYVSSWMIRRGAGCVGIDNSEQQLETARRLASEHGVDLELIHGNAEEVPYPDGSFDFAISEYGAAIWADPYKWIPEAWRLLCAGGELSFIANHPLLMMTQRREHSSEVTRELLYPYFGMHRLDWVDEDGERGTVFNLPISEWMQLFEEVGFDLVAFHEIRNPKPEAEPSFDVPAHWAHDFPSELAWRLHKR